MKNVFDGIDIEKLSTEEATQLLIQVKAAQKALSGIQAQKNSRILDK